jgi:hypothetical protein
MDAVVEPWTAQCLFHRISVNRGKQVAAVATARKLAVLIWHMLSKGQDYNWTRPASSSSNSGRFSSLLAMNPVAAERSRVPPVTTA